MNNPGFTQVLIALVLVLIALGINKWWKISVGKDISIGSVRAFVQLIAIGYALQFIFSLESTWLIILTLLIMIVVAAHTSSGRVKHVPNSFIISFTAILAGSFITLVLMLACGIISLQAKYMIPLGGMIIGNSMNSAALAIERISSDIINNNLAIETSLSLGKNWRSASQTYQRKAAIAGMLSMINFLKTVGLVSLPGAMTGMILAGADPLDAVYLQIIVGYMLISAVSIASIVSVELAVRKYFNRNHQLLSID